jgi:hypothetical protein
MQSPAFGQQESYFRRNCFPAVQQMLQGRFLGSIGVAAFQWSLQLLRIPEQY